jgi:uncharacterized protein YpmS
MLLMRTTFLLTVRTCLPVFRYFSPSVFTTSGSSSLSLPSFHLLPHLVHEVLEYQQVVSIVKSFVEAHPNTAAISVSDHETGGISKGSQPTTLLGAGTFAYYSLIS